MSRLPNTSGGGAQTNRAGLFYEDTVDIVPFIDSQPGYDVEQVGNKRDHFNVLYNKIQ